jgi:hypothetical protein
MTLWMLDHIDMAKAKEILGDVACIFGNMPSAMLHLGTPQDVRDYAKKLIDTCGRGGGFIMANGAFFDQAKPENVKALVDFTKEFAVGPTCDAMRLEDFREAPAREQQPSGLLKKQNRVKRREAFVQTRVEQYVRFSYLRSEA